MHDGVYMPAYVFAPKYPAQLCVPVADVAMRRQLGLRSSSRGLLNCPRYNMSTYGRRVFCFAAPYVWNSLPEHYLAPATAFCDKFSSFVNESGLLQFVLEPTRHENILDVLLTNVPDLISDLQVQCPLTVSYTHLTLPTIYSV